MFFYSLFMFTLIYNYEYYVHILPLLQYDYDARLDLRYHSWPMDLVIINTVAKIVTRNILNSSSSSEDSDEDIIFAERRKRPKVVSYIENVVTQWDDLDFRSHFRLTRTAVEILLLELNFKNCVTPGRPPNAPLDSLLLTLWTLANQESFRGIADRFGVSKGNAHNICINTCQLICNLRNQYIVWPREEDLAMYVQKFDHLRNNATFPNVIGCVDGTHIEIRGTKKDNSFYNRKGVHSMILQGICNSQLEFLDIYCGWPGSAHDARVWQNSPIFSKLSNDRILPDQYHLLGDTAYPLNSFIMVPFKDNGHLTVQQKKYNKILSKIRVLIEHAFGRLKGIFRRLLYLNLTKYSNFKYIVVAACVLHNFIIKHNVPVHYEFNEQEIEENEQVYMGRVNNINAVQKRNTIMLNLN